MVKEFIEFFVFAVFVASFASIIGIGGGVIIVPVFTLVFKLPIHQAISAALIASLSNSVTGAASYLKQEITNIRLGIFLLAFTTIGAIVGASVAVLMSEWILCIIFSGLILFILVVPYIGSSKVSREQDIDGFSKYMNIRATYYDKALKKDVEYNVHGMYKGGALAMLAGLGSGMLGISGGVINVRSMSSFMDVPIKAAVGTSQFMFGITAAVSAIIYFLAGHINLYIVGPIAIGTVLGALIGSSIMNKLPAGIIRVIFTLLLMYLSYEMFAKGILQGFHVTLPGLL